MEIKELEWDYLGWKKFPVLCQKDWNRTLVTKINYSNVILAEYFLKKPEKEFACYKEKDTSTLNFFAEKTYKLFEGSSHQLDIMYNIKIDEGKMHHSIIKIYDDYCPEVYVTINILNF